MKVIFAQGNPGSEYAHTRHNVGFLAIDTIAATYQATFADKSKFHAQIAETTRAGEKILFVKPTTFYNDTGQSARQIIDFYKLDPATDFIVIHDDLALPFGTIRTRTKGQDAGNNGIKSLNSHLGQEYSRIRIGIYNERRERMDDVDFVLGKFNSDEQDNLPRIFKEVAQFTDQFIQGQFDPTKITVI